MQSEGEVVRLPFAEERSEGFAAFFAREHRGLLKFLYFVTGNRADAAELMQDAFLRMWSGGIGSMASATLARTCSGSR
jgi:DNA-directed RNA polymerase specialized sigma24 family protein